MNLLLKGNRVYLRNLKRDDATEKYSSWFSDSVTSKFIVSKNQTISQLREYIEEKNGNPNCLFLGIFLLQSNEHIGNVKLEPIDISKRKATLGIILGEIEQRGKGYATETMELILDHGFNKMGFLEIDLGTCSMNVAAMKLYSKFGFIKKQIQDIDFTCPVENKHDHFIMSKKSESLEKDNFPLIDLKLKTEIIAEIAQGYEGNPYLAKLLTKGAIKAGADAIKFQLVYADELATSEYFYYDFFKKLEMSIEIWDDIVKKVHKAGKKIYFDIFGPKSLEVAIKLNADGVKLSTTEFYNELLMRNVLTSSFKKIFISIGGIPLDDIKDLIKNNFIIPSDRIVFMYGVQSEPTQLEQNNLNRIKTLKEELYGFKIGFMDHSMGDSEEAFYLPVLALGTGINCIEKHITLDHSLEIEDYISALTPRKFKIFINIIRIYEAALGKSNLELTQLEKEYQKKAGKVVVVNRDLPPNTIIFSEDVELKRVGDRFKEARIFRSISQVLGKKTTVALKKDDAVVEDILCEN